MTTEKYERLKVVRRGHRGVVTKLTREVDTLLGGETTTSEQLARLNIIYEQLENKMQLLQGMDSEIVTLCNLDDVEGEIDESESVLAKILEYKGRVSAVIKPSLTTSRALSTAETVSGSVTSAPIVSGTSLPTVNTRLPKLVLPKFRGNVTTWISFWDAFKAAVHENNSITKIDKFNYLNSLLEGAAAMTIQGLSLTEANYDSAVEMLKERFGNTQQIITSHMEELLKLPECTGDKVSALRGVHDTMNVHIRGLSSLGINPEQYGSLLVPIVMSKLPNDLRLRIARENRGEVWEMNKLMETIKSEVEAREASEAAKVNMVKTSSFRGNTRNPNSTANALMAGSQNIQCAYCKGNHFSASCQVVKTVEDRKAILIRDGRCFVCLRPQHRAQNCDSNKKCRKCNRRHHQSLCDQSKKNPENPGDQKEVSSTNTSNSVKDKKTVLLQTAKAIACDMGESNKVTVRILFDSGSQRSYMTESLKHRLKLGTVKKEKLHLNTFGDDRFKSRECDVVRVKLTKQNMKEAIVIDVLSFPTICTPLPPMIKVDPYPCLKDLELADDSHDKPSAIDVLIGSDYYWTIVTGEVMQINGGPTAMSSKLGWLLSGPTQGSPALLTITSLAVNQGIHHPLTTSEDDLLLSTLKCFWQLESVGILNEPCVEEEPELFLRNLRHTGIRYELNLPWRIDLRDLPDHQVMCVNRLKTLLYRLHKNEVVLQEYDKTIQEQLEKGIIERVPNSDESNGPIHYLPHLPVVRTDRSTTKVRVVYDGSAKSNESSLSLNDCLYKGPNLIPKLFDVLIRFRNHPVALTGDIEKAFLMIGIEETDRDMLRFLWLSNPYDVNSELLHLRFTRLVFGLKPSPAILGAVILKHCERYKVDHPNLVKVINNDLYVDDLISGEETVQKAFELYKSAKGVMALGGFNLRKWHTNSSYLRKLIEEAENNGKGETSLQFDIAAGSEEKPKTDSLLGVLWDGQADAFTFRNEIDLPCHGDTVTKRTLLRVAASIFDPLGFLSPYVIKFKMLFQRLCANHVEWDESLSGNTLKTWNALISGMHLLSKVKVPRCYFQLEHKPLDVHLHCFCDASELAYAAVLYVRCDYGNDHIEIRLVTAKTRVAPMKQQTIPRLELLGALILARLLKSVIMQLNEVSRVYCWTDSMTVLQWIRNKHVYRQYVQNRIDEIRQKTEGCQWRHCPGNINPADLPSRGLSASDLIETILWWEGPCFLKLSPSKWPDAQLAEFSTQANAERVKNPPTIIHSMLGLEVEGHSLSKVIEINRYSSFKFLLRVSAYVLRFIKNVRSHDQNRQNTHLMLETSELQLAEMSWIRSVQYEFFPEAICYLKQLTRKKPVLVDQFRLFIDEQQIIRCRGRINNANLPIETKRPIILPRHSRFVQLLIKYIHLKNLHSSVRDTLVCLREKYWIIKGRQVVRSVIKSCVQCKRYEGKPFNTAMPPDLPAVRVSEDPPFTHVGLDFAGPLYVKDRLSESQSKSYVCVFTCASTRGVHLELTHGLDIDNFLLALRRFSGRRGFPATILSDNAKTFKASSKEVVKLTRAAEVQCYLTNNRVTWNFIVEKAPWWGGFWERMVQGVKKSLRKVIGRAHLNFEELRTLLVEVEALLNARPLTYVQEDDDGVNYTLSPSHLMYGRRVTSMPNDNHFDVVSTYQGLTKRKRNHVRMLEHFTRQWRQDYLTNLREVHSLKCRNEKRSVISVGDVVILKDDTSKRMYWKLALVEDLVEGRDGQIRAALVKVVNSDGKYTKLRRSLKHLIPVEVQPNQGN